MVSAFSVAYWALVYLPLQSVCLNILSNFHWIAGLFIIELQDFLIYPSYQYVINIFILQILSQSVACPFSFLVLSFDSKSFKF